MLYLGYFILVNLLLFTMMGFDKRKAVTGKYRIPERRLFMMAFIGGAIGGWMGMQLFRHKTKHMKFVVGFPMLIIFDLVIFYTIYRLWSVGT
ncbi:DUF1294 domain-containing protein [Aneurinibacillus terranovensis]|uniref:DUF1294 domain-containing protein n=1 Tax=Aneurinibacillus terranovensis TaxID=278991 RepID=UPI0004160DA9|nr:DUF1294 domain-containing protein [Aneurinibacillus terranovensis]